MYTRIHRGTYISHTEQTLLTLHTVSAGLRLLNRWCEHLSNERMSFITPGKTNGLEWRMHHAVITQHLLARGREYLIPSFFRLCFSTYETSQILYMCVCVCA